MSEILLPDYLHNIRPIEVQEAPTPDADEITKNMAVPKPTGWKVLCMVPPAKDKFDNSEIVKADAVIRNEELGTTVRWAASLGEDAYSDVEKFPNGAWCEKGDFVLVRAYAGTRFKVF